MAKIRNNEVWLEKMRFGCRFQQYTIEVCTAYSRWGIKFFKGCLYAGIHSGIPSKAISKPHFDDQ